MEMHHTDIVLVVFESNCFLLTTTNNKGNRKSQSSSLMFSKKIAFSAFARSRIPTRSLRAVPLTISYGLNQVSARAFAAEAKMFCYQCEQTSGGKGCTSLKGVCGKDAQTAGLQDLQLHFNIGLAQWADAVLEKGGKIPEQVKESFLNTTFATLTNVNFDAERFYQYLSETDELRNGLREQAVGLGFDVSRLQGPALFQYKDNKDFLNLEANYHGVLQRKSRMNDEDTLVVREMVVYGLKGTIAYFNHAERIRKTNPDAYSEADRDEVYAKLFKSFASVSSEKLDTNEMLGAALNVGAINLKVMELLDGAHTKTFGHPEPTTVSSIPTTGKCILVSGHDIIDLYKLLKHTENRGINIYTHGEMLPANAYPELKKFRHFKGHFGQAWQRQKQDFAMFPGAILLTSNCLVEPLSSYKNRVFTTNAVGFAGVRHLGEFEFEPLVQCARNSPGFKPEDCEKGTSTRDSLVIGFGHHAVLSVADKVLDAVHNGDLKNIFVIGGCDGSEGERSYFTDLGATLPKDAIALTLGCGKFRLNGLDMGTLPNGIPRLLDFGQCNDSYGAVVVALALAKALNTDVNGLPLHFAISWFEQKAVAVLLTLLHLNVQNIYLGPHLPAFLTPNVLNILVEKFKLKPTGNADTDLQNMLSRRG